MQIKTKTNGKLAAGERGELKAPEVTGFLIVCEPIDEQAVLEYSEWCSRNVRNAVVLDTRERASPKILVYAWSLKHYFELLKRCETLYQIEAADPYSGKIEVIVDDSSAVTIATELAAFKSAVCSPVLSPDLGAVSIDMLAEWLVCLPISLENYGLLQLLQAGKLRGEPEVSDGQAAVVFKSSGSIEALASFRLTWPGVEAMIVELFARGGLDFSVSTRDGKPAILWRCNSTAAEEVLRMMGPANPTRQ